MDYLKNHCWCSDSNWGGDYDCQIIVSLSSYEDHDEEDWKNVFTKKKVFSQSRYDELKEIGVLPEEQMRELSVRSIVTPKPEVLKWLEDNVPEKQWCIGSDEYIATDSCCSFAFFFQLRRDAMAFIKAWSKWGKPVNYCQYFTDVRKTLNLETLKYEVK